MIDAQLRHQINKNTNCKIIDLVVAITTAWCAVATGSSILHLISAAWSSLPEDIGNKFVEKTRLVMNDLDPLTVIYFWSLHVGPESSPIFHQLQVHWLALLICSLYFRSAIEQMASLYVAPFNFLKPFFSRPVKRQKYPHIHHKLKFFRKKYPHILEYRFSTSNDTKRTYLTKRYAKLLIVISIVSQSGF